MDTALETPYAIISLAGKQFIVHEGDRFSVNRLETEEGETLTIDEVLLTANDDGFDVGTPTVDGASVELEILEHTRADKVEVRKFRSKSRYRRNYGHKQPISMVEVKTITLG